MPVPSYHFIPIRQIPIKIKGLALLGLATKFKNKRKVDSDNDCNLVD